MGWGIDDIIPMIQFFDASMVGGFGPDLRILHNFIPIDKEFRFKVVSVPELEQRHIKTDMCWVQSAVLGELDKYTIQMFDIIDVLQTLDSVMNLVLFQHLHDLMVLIIEHSPDFGIR